MLKKFVKGIVSAGALVSANVFAMPLSDYNLIVLDDFTGSVHVQGKTFIGGDMNVNKASVFSTDAELKLSNSLNVIGDIGQSRQIIHVENGDVAHGGNITADVQVHRGKTVQDSSLSIAAIASELSNTSNSYANLVENGVVSGDMNQRRLTYTGSESVAVFNIDANLFSRTNGMMFDLGSAERAIINVSGNNVEIHSAFNFLGASNDIFDKVLWNFHEATTVDFKNRFLGSVLANQASVTNYGFDMDGAVAALNYTSTTTNELHSYLFDAPETSVSEPSPAILFLLGCGFLGLSVRRKRKA